MSTNSWTCVTSDFDGDETAHFGARIESGSSLYQVNTLATISSKEKVESTTPPQTVSSVLGDFGCLAISKDLSIFKDLQFVVTLSFGDVIDAVEWSPDAVLLAVGTHDGSIHLVETEQYNILLNFAIFNGNNVTGDAAFKRIIFQEKSIGEGICDVFFLSTNGIVCIMQNFDLFMFTQGCDNPEKLLKGQMKLDTSQYHTITTTEIISHGSRFFTFGQGDCIMCMWSVQDDDVKLVDFVDNIYGEDTGIIAAKISSDGKHLFTINQDRVLSLWNADTFVCFKIWHDQLVCDFQLLETTDIRNNDTRGMKLVILEQNDNHSSSLSVLELPSLDSVYTLQLNSHTKIAHCKTFQESLYVIEGCFEESSPQIITTIRFRCLTEAEPETRLRRLLSKKLFEQAEEFAKTFNLDVELVYAVKVRHILDLLSPWNSSHYSTEELDTMIVDLWRCLELIKDDLQIAECCMKAALPTYQETSKLLQYCKSRLLKTTTPDTMARQQQLLADVLEMLHRLLTYRIIYGIDKYNPVDWDDFMNVNLLEESMRALTRGCQHITMTIWKRHKTEWSKKINAHVINQLLRNIPNELNSSEIMGWFRDDLIPYVSSTLPLSMKSVVSWIMEKIKMMEYSEKSKWPLNALKFGQALYKKINEVLQINLTDSISPADNTAKTQINYKSEIQPLCDMVVVLQNLYNLEVKNSCRLTLAQFKQETTESLTFRMLDQIKAVELLVPALQRQIIPYIEEHDLNVDYILARYIKDLVERCGHIRPTLGTSLWELKTEAIISFITDKREKCLAILDIMKMAPLPWSEDTEKMIKSGMKLDHPMVAELKEQCRLVEVKKILYKYGLKNAEVQCKGKAEHLIKYIIRNDQPTAVEDAIRVSDALELTCKLELYKERCFFLIQKNRIYDYIEFLQSLSSHDAIHTAQRIIHFSIIELADTKFSQLNTFKDRKRQFTEAAVATATYLQKQIHDTMKVEEWRKLREILHNVLLLQVEYDEYMTVEQYKSPKYRDGVFIRHVVKFSSNNKADVNDFKIYRLADLLMIPRVKLQGRMAVHAADKGDVVAALKHSKKLLESEESAEKVRAIVEVVRALIKLLCYCDMDIEETRTIPDVTYQLACTALTQSAQDDLIECLDLCKSIHLLLSVSSECEASGLQPVSTRNQRKGSVSSGADVNKKFTLDVCFKEDSLVINSAIALPLVANFLKVNPRMKIAVEGKEVLEMFFNAAIILIQHLKENSHYQLTYRVVCMMYGISIAMLQENKGVSLQGEELDEYTKQMEKIERRCQPLIKDLSSGVLSKLFSCTKVDHKLGLAYLLSLPPNTCMEAMKKMLSSAGHNYKKLMAVATVGIGVGEVLNKPSAIQTCQALEKNGSWGYKLSKFKISFKEAFDGGPNDRLKVLTQLGQSGAADVKIIKEFCKAFELEIDDGLYIYLENVFAQSNNAPDMEDEQKKRIRFYKASETIEAIKEKGAMRKKLKQMLQKTSVYNYEAIEFILTILHRYDTDPQIKQGLELVNRLRFYKRRGSPSAEELRYDVDGDSEEISTVLGTIPTIGKTRLPYHLLMGPDVWKIIKPELDNVSVKFWLSIANILQLKVDEVYILAVQNMVMKHVACQRSADKQTEADKSKCNWAYNERSVEFLDEIQSLLVNVTNLKLVMACSSWFVKELPMGAEKILGLKCCVKFAEKWLQVCADDDPQKMKAQQAYVKFSTTLKRLSTERVLFYYNVTNAEILKLANEPVTLINKLYELPCVTASELDLTIERPDINAMVKEIVEIHGLSFQKICMSLIEKWLPSSASKQNDEATCTFSFNNFNLSEPVTDMDDDDVNLKRVIYLLQKDTVKENAVYLYNFADNSSSNITNLCKARALLCLLKIVDENTIQETLSVSIQHLRHMLRIRSYLVDLSELHIQHSPSTFEECNKEGLVRGIWKNHNHQKTGILLSCALCIDYNINDTTLWTGILKQLILLANVKHLEYVLGKLSSLPNIWSLPYYSKAWHHLLLTPLSKVSSPLEDGQIEECLHYFNLLYECPVISNLDLKQLSQQYEDLELDICASACLLIAPDANKDCVKDILKDDKRKYIQEIERFTKLGMTSIAVTQVSEAIFGLILEEDDYTAVVDSPLQNTFVLYVIKKDQIDGLLVFALSNGRLKEANSLFQLYMGSNYMARNNVEDYMHTDGANTELEAYIKMTGIMEIE